MQHGREYCKVLMIRMDINVRICRKSCRDSNYFIGEKIERKHFVNAAEYTTIYELLMNITRLNISNA